MDVAHNAAAAAAADCSEFVAAVSEEHYNIR